MWLVSVQMLMLWADAQVTFSLTQATSDGHSPAAVTSAESAANVPPPKVMSC